MKRFAAVLLALSVMAAGGAVFAEPEVDDAVAAETAVSAEAEENSEVFDTAEIAEETEADEETADEAEYEDAELPQDEADGDYIEAAVPEKELSTEFTLDIYVTPRKYIVSSNAIIELYTMDDELLGSQLRYVGWDTPSVTMTFDVPEYRMGEKFRIKLVDGLRSIWYYGEKAQIGETLDIQTYGYLDENGEYVQCNGGSISANPNFEKEIHLYITNKWYNDLTPRARLIDGIAMMPVRTAGEAMGLDVKYNPEWDSVTLSLDDHKTVFWANNEYMTYPGGDKNASHVPVYIDGSLFVPVRDLAEAFECSVDATDYGEFIDILIGEAPYHQVIRNRIPVNARGIGSRTNYLIWVSKHEYKVRVYQGQQYHWTQLKEFPCALGAWNTPTITGQFEILERTRWDYGSYYVGPVLRFYNGYALHSTLLNYGGGEYDGRVGVNISHGCVRLHPQDINWISSTVPMKTRVYITE